MQLTSEFEILLQDVTNDLNRHTGKSKFYKESCTINTESQGQILKVTIQQIIKEGQPGYNYWVDIDDRECIIGPVHQETLKGCHDHIYCLVISRLGDKVLDSLL